MQHKHFFSIVFLSLIIIVIPCTKSFAQKSSSDFVFTVNTLNPGSSNSSNFLLDAPNPPNTPIPNFDIDWNNDGIFDQLNVRGSINIQYGSPGIYTIRIRGVYTVLAFGNGDKDKLISIDQWGSMPWSKIQFGFNDCDSLLATPLDTPDFSNVTSAKSMFRGAYSFNGDVNHWDMSNVNDLDQMFFGTRSFNSPVNNWDVSSVTNMSGLFSFSIFNQPLNSWDVSSVVNMQYLFRAAIAFNQPLNNWDVSSVTNFYGTFDGASSFNQNIDGWDVSSAIDMREMFQNCASYNQPLNSWDVSAATNMWGMFRASPIFNQALNNWDVSSVQIMRDMFESATNFNQDLSSWDYSGIATGTYMGRFLANTNISATYYDSLIIHFNTNHSGLDLSFLSNGLSYCSSISERSRLISLGWSFLNDRLNCQIVGLSEIQTERFNYYPNPASNQIIIDFKNSYVGDRLQLFNFQGQLISERVILQKKMLFEISEYPNGLYFLKVGDKTQKLIIQR